MNLCFSVIHTFNTLHSLTFIKIKLKKQNHNLSLSLIVDFVLKIMNKIFKD